MRRERITSADLGDAVAALNRELGRQPGTPGAYGILGAYDGWQLATFAAAGAGSVDHVALPVGHGYHPRRAVYDAVQAIRHGLALGRAGTPLRAGTLNAIADLMESIEAEPVATGNEWTDEHAALCRVQQRPTVQTLAGEPLARAELDAWAVGHCDFEPADAADTRADVAVATAMQEGSAR